MQPLQDILWTVAPKESGDSSTAFGLAQRTVVFKFADLALPPFLSPACCQCREAETSARVTICLVKVEIERPASQLEVRDSADVAHRPRALSRGRRAGVCDCNTTMKRTISKF